MPNAWAYRAMLLPIVPKPTPPSVLLDSPTPIRVCHFSPARTEATSAGMWRANARCRPQVSSGVGIGQASSAANGKAPRGGGLQIDGRVPHAGGDKQLQSGKTREHGSIETGPFPHGDDDLEPGELFRQCVRRRDRIREILDLHAVQRAPIGEAEGAVLIIIENGTAEHGCFGI